MPIARDETAETLYAKVTEAHLELVRRYVPELLDGSAPRIPQDTRRASAWPKRTPADGIIDWETRAPYLYDWVRAQTRPYPGAFTYLGDEKVVVWRARPVEVDEPSPPGRSSATRGTAAVVACGEGGLVLEEVEGVTGPLPVGGPARMKGSSCSRRIPDDDVLGMGGTLSLHAAERGDEVRVVCVTDGSSTQYPDDAETRAQKNEEARAGRERARRDGLRPPRPARHAARHARRTRS